MRISDWSSDVCSSDLAELQAFVRGLAEASRWCIQNRKESASVVAKNLNITDTALVSRMMDAIDWWPAKTPEFELDVRKIAAFLKVPMDWNRQFDSRFTQSLEIGRAHV